MPNHLVSLLIIGVFNILSFNIVHISEDIGKTFEFNIYIKDSVSEKDLETVAENVRSIENVKSAEIKTKTQALDEVKGKLDKSAAIQQLSYADNPFSTVVESGTAWLLVTTTVTAEMPITIITDKIMASGFFRPILISLSS